MAELTLVPAVDEDPDREKWARYWQRVREESITLLGDAFDTVAKDFAAGDARAAVDILVFCADESRGHGGIYAAIGDLLTNYNRVLLAADEVRAGASLDEIIKMVSL